MIVHRLSARRKSLALALFGAAVVVAAGAMPADAAGKRQAEADEAQSTTLAGGAALAIVSLARQRVSLYDAEGRAVRASVSSGQTGYETPVGVYSVLQKKEEHYSNLYDDAEMPFMQRITWSGIALHAGQLPGYPASHGCVRLPHNFAQSIFGMTRLGTRVIVARDDVAPSVISHPALFQPKPLGEETAVATPTAFSPAEEADGGDPLLPDVARWPARQRLLDELKTVAADKAAVAKAASDAAEAPKTDLRQKTAARNKALKAVRTAEAAKRKAEERVVRAEKALAAAKKPESVKAAEESKAKAQEALAKVEAQLAAANAQAQPAVDAFNQATEASKAAEAAKAAAEAAAKEARWRMLPVSVFVSRKTQRLYVRQGFEPVLDVPVAIRDPEQPIGTYIFTALDYSDDGNGMRWNTVSLAQPGDDAEPAPSRKRRKSERAEAPPATDAAAAAAALDRVAFPPEVLARVSEYVWPGSSLIISDEEASKETGKATDFVVLISGYPQGGIKKRPRQPDNYFRYDPYGPYYDYYDRPRRYRYQKNGPFFSLW